MSVLSPADSQVPSLWASSRTEQTRSHFPKVSGNFPLDSLAFVFLPPLLPWRAFNRHITKRQNISCSVQGKKWIRNAGQLTLNTIFNYRHFIIYFVLWTAYQDDPFLVSLIKFCWPNVTFQTSLLIVWPYISPHFFESTFPWNYRLFIFFNSPRFCCLNFLFTLHSSQHAKMTYPEQHHIVCHWCNPCLESMLPVWWMG